MFFSRVENLNNKNMGEVGCNCWQRWDKSDKFDWVLAFLSGLGVMGII